MKNRYNICLIFVLIIVLLFIYILLNNKNIEKFTNTERLNVAVFFSGRIKDYELEIEHLIKLKNKYNATFFVSINESKELDYMKDFFKRFDVNEDQKNIESTPLVSNIVLLNCPNETNTNYANIFSMYYHNSRCYQLINSYQIKNSIIFDVILKYRVDIDNDNIIKITKPKLNTIHIPKGKDYEGINDQIAYGNNESMKLYCSIFEILANLCVNSTRFHPESLMAAGLKFYNLEIERFIYNYKLYKNRFKSD